MKTLITTLFIFSVHPIAIFTGVRKGGKEARGRRAKQKYLWEEKAKASLDGGDNDEEHSHLLLTYYTQPNVR